MNEQKKLVYRKKRMKKEAKKEADYRYKLPVVR